LKDGERSSLPQYLQTNLSALVVARDDFRGRLIRKIDRYVTHYNLASRPFIWTATADSILDKLQRLCKVINGTAH
jgi:hypothetical protein